VAAVTSHGASRHVREVGTIDTRSQFRFGAIMKDGERLPGAIQQIQRS
jgi:hypothetical protein